MKKWLLMAMSLSLTLILSACSTPQPKNCSNVCSIFHEYPKWYWAAQDAKKKWGVPISVQMAIMHQESRFKQNAKPPRTHLLWIIPWFRPTTAYGYTQALDVTWENYEHRTGNAHANRKDFHDATDFIGWYVSTAHRKAGISKFDTYDLYLAYHEGVGGFRRKTYLKKPWLMKVARKVARREKSYRAQLHVCQSTLPVKHWWNIF